MPDKLRERVGFRRQQGLGLDDKVVVTRHIKSGHEVYRDRSSRRVVVRRRELVDDGRHIGRRVLRGLRGLRNFGRDQDFDLNCHVDLN